MTDKLFEVHVYTHKTDENGAYGDFDQMEKFETYPQAREYYDNVRYYHGKEILKYASMDDDASGDVLDQDHPEDADLTERSFSVTKIDVLATCEINLTEEDLIELNGLSHEEMNKKIQENAIDSDMWRHVESEDNVSYEVDEN